MTTGDSRGWSRRRFLAGALGTSAVAAMTRDVEAEPRAGLTPAAQAQVLPAAAEERMRARLRLMRVALGQEPADVVIADGTMLDTITGELLPGWGVAIAGDRIAAVGDVDAARRARRPSR